VRLDEGLVLLSLEVIDVFLEGIVPVRIKSVVANACPGE
jgi:hypothetical protein